MADGQQRGDQLDPAGQGHRDNGFRLYPIGFNPGGQLLGPGREFGIGQAVGIILNRDHIRCAHRLSGEQLRQGYLGHRGGCGVVGIDQQSALSGIDDLDRVDTQVRISGDDIQDVQIPSGERLNGGVVKQVGGVLDQPRQRLRVPANRGPVEQVHRQIELGGMSGHRHGLDIETGQLERGCRIVL
ncbi:hypothetical protein MSIMFI_05538 [Mycobacterium simulans]|nr:hypothetical protein MSIMFI_05538 [Mycobacterium simulans]